MTDAAGRGPAASATAVLLGGLAGGILAGLAFGTLLMVRNPGIAVEDVAALLTHPERLQESYAWTLAAGAAIGLIAVGAVLRVRLFVSVVRGLWAGLRMYVGTGLGAAAGVTAYLLLWIASNPGAPFAFGLRQLVDGIRQPGDPLRTFLLAGGVAGLGISVYVISGRGLRRWTRAATGVVIGSLAGLVIYAVAYVLVHYPQVPGGADYLFHFGEAVHSFSPVEFLFLTFGGVIGLAMSNYSWRLYGILTLIALVSVVSGYIAYTLTQTLPLVSGESRLFSWALFTVESLSLFLVLLYSFYSIDVATRKHWRRTSDGAWFSPYFLPKVAIHVPVYNEPPEVILPTLRTLIGLDYPVDRYLIVVVDDSTEPAYAAAVRSFCERHRTECQIVYQRRADRRGYKAGALNDALALTPDDALLVAVIDADYQVRPEFLRETVGHFIDPNLGWLQTPQDYRNQDQSFLTRQYYLADSYFYRAILPSRNEQNSIIFCGTMGMLRKRALVEVGGWGEEYITEDAEISFRLVQSGWKSMYVNKTYGRGLIPATFEGYKKQHYRWAFGGGRIVRGHWRDFFSHRLSRRQRFDYLVGNVAWFEGAFILVIATAVLLMGLAELFGLTFVSHHSSEVLLVGLVPWFLLVDGLTRVHMVLRRTMNLGFGSTLRILGMWFSVKFSNAAAAFKALFGVRIPFVRTRKLAPERLGHLSAIARALRLTRFESVMALLLFLTAGGIGFQTWATPDAPAGEALSDLLLVLWLSFYGLAFSAAPFYAYRSYVTLVPEPARATVPARPVGLAA